MDNNENMKKRLYSNSNIEEADVPVAKKQKVEEVSIIDNSFDNLPNEIKEKIIRCMDIKTPAQVYFGGNINQ